MKPVNMCLYCRNLAVIFEISLYLAVPLGVSRYANHLIAVYNKNQATVEWPNVQISYVNLAIVESMIKDFTQKEEDDCILAMMQSNIEEVQKHKKPLNISQVGVLVLLNTSVYIQKNYTCSHCSHPL